jgi:hypothetical protein
LLRFSPSVSVLRLRARTLRTSVLAAGLEQGEVSAVTHVVNTE